MNTGLITASTLSGWIQGDNPIKMKKTSVLIYVELLDASFMEWGEASILMTSSRKKNPNL